MCVIICLLKENENKYMLDSHEMMLFEIKMIICHHVYIHVYVYISCIYKSVGKCILKRDVGSLVYVYDE